MTARLPREIVVKGKHAYARVMTALAKEFPGRVPESLVKIDRAAVEGRAQSKETKMIDHALLEALDTELTKLEHELSHLFAMSKAKKSDTVEDDWSAAADNDN